MFVNLFAFVAFSIISQLLAKESILDDVGLDKRVPMRFQGIRGKKDIISNLDDDNFSKRAPMSFQGMRGKKDLVRPDLNDLIDAYEKRGPMGFQGVRGKKDSSLTSVDFDDGFYHEDYEKRIPMGFQGMRGKKAMLDDELDERSMMGFQGMLGKNSFDEIIYELEKRAELHKMSNELYMNQYPDEYEKRAGVMGLQGMRGKKDEYENLDWDKTLMMEFQGKHNFLEELENLEKRDIMGFQGMRGKKDRANNYYGYIIDPTGYEKRASMGFQGMRGKKDDDKLGNMGFVGMRGKRNVMGIYDINDGYYENSKNLQASNAVPFNKRTSYGFFGTRGKKIPRWEIRGKFVGVRGKKWAPNLDRPDNLMINQFGSAEQIDLKTDSIPKFNTQ